MIIIIEGVDGCGKSTLAKMLSKKTNWPILKPFNRSQNDGLFTLQKYFPRGKFNGYFEQCLLMDFILQAKKQYDFNCILDRSMITTDVYQSAFKGYDNSAELSQWWHIRLKELSHIIVYLKLDDDSCYLNQMKEKALNGLKSLNGIIDVETKKREFISLTKFFDEKMDWLQHSGYSVKRFQYDDETQRNWFMGKFDFYDIMKLLKDGFHI